MTLEINYYYSITGVGAMHKDAEKSVPEREISRTEFDAYTDLLKKMGAMGHENSKEIFFDLVDDARHIWEYRFIK